MAESRSDSDADPVPEPAPPSASPPAAPAGPPTSDEIAACIRVLNGLREAPQDDPDFLAVQRAVTDLRKHRKRRRRRLGRHKLRGGDRVKRAEASKLPPSEEPTVVAELDRPRACYMCKKPYRAVSAHWDQHCPSCAREEAYRRFRSADLTGRRALLTGGRIKIGFETGLRLLRWGAHLDVTTRFPVDAAKRYAAEDDFEVWRDRLTIHALDMQRLREVVVLAEVLARRAEPFDIIVHNAAQTVWRPPVHHAALYAEEEKPPPPLLVDLLGGDRASAEEAALAKAAPGARALFVEGGALLEEESGLATDFRPVNSWVQRIGDVGPVEVVTAHVVNAISPFILTNRLVPLMRGSSFEDRYVVNVSAMEGKFRRAVKGEMHPHTNMAKAALNMLTRTSADDLADDAVYMCSVDTGWVTDEAPIVKQDVTFRPPLDSADGAVRVLDPILRGVVDGKPVWNCFLKDYAVSEDW